MYKNVSVIIISACLCAACGDTTVQETSAEAWDVPQPLPIKQGLYKVEFEILEDGCQPSLRELAELNPEWVGNTTVVSHLTRNEGVLSVWKMGIGLFHLRANEGGALILDHVWDFIHLSSFNEEGAIASFDVSIKDGLNDYGSSWFYLQNIFARCIEGKQNNQFKEETNVFYVSESEFVFESTSNWYLEQPCSIHVMPELNGSKILPKSTCVERYRKRIKLERECPTSCQMTGGALCTSYYFEGYGYHGHCNINPDEIPVSCVCNGEVLW